MGNFSSARQGLPQAGQLAAVMMRPTSRFCLSSVVVALLTVAAVSGTNTTCDEHDDAPYCAHLEDPSQCLWAAQNYTVLADCKHRCGCWGDTSCCYDDIHCTPVFVPRSGTCCPSKSGWCQDGRDGQGNMHAVCCEDGVSECARDPPVHGLA